MEWISRWNDTLTGIIAGGEFGLLSVLALFAAGLLAALLPCVYPLYPITAQVLKARGSGRAWVHPLVYYSGLVFMYAIFGVIAGVTGGAFNQALRMPVVNLLIGALILILGIAGLGWIHLPLFGGLRADRGPAGLTGTWILGMGAGLLSSPCVGPVVVTILLEITANVSGMDPGIVLNSSLRMLVFGLGVGLPFLLIGVFGLKLPRSGRWMRIVQYGLGIFILYFAFTYYWKGMISLRFQPWLIYALPALLLAAAFAIYSVLKGSVHERASRALASAIILAVILIGAGVLTGRGRIELEAKYEQIGNLRWHRLPEPALQEARETGRNVFIDFYADWCTNCIEFSRLMQQPGALNQALSEAVRLKITDTDPAFLVYEEDARYPELRIGLPFFAVLSPSGELIYKTNDYLAHEKMIQAIRRKR